MFALFIDVVGSFFLAKWLKNWWAWLPLAVLLGIISSFVGHVLIYYIYTYIELGNISKMETIFSAAMGSVQHALICIIATAIFRHKGKKRIVPASEVVGK